jgi:hypothetical protein
MIMTDGIFIGRKESGDRNECVAAVRLEGSIFTLESIGVQQRVRYTLSSRHDLEAGHITVQQVSNNAGLIQFNVWSVQCRLELRFHLSVAADRVQFGRCYLGTAGHTEE